MKNAENYFLQPGEIIVSQDLYLIHTILGSCVSVCLWDDIGKVGGMNHYILSRTMHGDRNGKYGEISIPYLIKLVLSMGGKRQNLKAHVIGGGCNPELTPHVSEENISIALEMLDKNRIRTVTKDIGGKTGRKVIFNNLSGEIIVYKGVQIEREDW